MDQNLFMAIAWGAIIGAWFGLPSALVGAVKDQLAWGLAGFFVCIAGGMVAGAFGSWWGMVPLSLIMFGLAWDKKRAD